MGNLQSALPGSLPGLSPTGPSVDEEDKLIERMSRASRAPVKNSLCIAQGTNLPLYAASRGFTRVLGQLGSAPEAQLFTQVRDSKLRTPLHLAAKAGQANAVAILIDPDQLGADLYAVDKRGNTALHLAAGGAEDGHVECVSLLVTASKAHEQQQQQQVPAGRLPGTGRRSSRRSLVDMQNAEGLTALHIAAATGNLDVVQLLLTSGADLCLMTFKPTRDWPWLHQVPARSTALHLAAASGHVMVAKAIVQAFLDIPRDVRKPDPRLLHDIEGHVPYMVAGNHGHWICAQLLLLISADNTHQYWHSYMNLGGVEELERGPVVPSLASLAQAVWLARLEEQLSEVAATSLRPTPRTTHTQVVVGAPAEVPVPAAADQTSAADNGPAAADEQLAASSMQEAGTATLDSPQDLSQEQQPLHHARCPSSHGAASLQQAMHAPELERAASAVSASALSATTSATTPQPAWEEGTARGRTCEVCFERSACAEMLLCGHSLCASCSKRVVHMEERRGSTAPPKCPFCQQVILGFAPRCMSHLLARPPSSSA